MGIKYLYVFLWVCFIFNMLCISVENSFIFYLYCCFSLLCIDFFSCVCQSLEFPVQFCSSCLLCVWFSFASCPFVLSSSLITLIPLLLS